MLRALECDPGPIDGKHEILTTEAIEAFQASYVQGAYHQEDEPRLKPALEADGKLGGDSREALIDAYVSRFSPRLSPDAFVAEGLYIDLTVPLDAFNKATDAGKPIPPELKVSVIREVYAADGVKVTLPLHAPAVMDCIRTKKSSTEKIESMEMKKA